MRILAVSDRVEPQLYNSSIARWLGPVDLLISCGDLPPYYLDFLISFLNVPMYQVIGNHCYVPHDVATNKCLPEDYPGVSNLNGRTAEYNGLLMAGAEGSPLYNGGPHQYTNRQFAQTLLRLVPGLLANKARVGRYLDVLVTHAPPRGTHDNPDTAHRGFPALVPFITRFKPTLLLHGHTHRYDFNLPMHTDLGRTHVINTYGHILLELGSERSGWLLNNETLRGAKL